MKFKIPPHIGLVLRPGADQSSKAAFGKGAFAKTCFLLLNIRLGAHQSSKKQKCFRARLSTFWHVLAKSIWRETRENAFSFGRSKDALSKSKFASSKSAFAKSKFALSKSAFAKSSFATLVCARRKKEVENLVFQKAICWLGVELKEREKKKGRKNKEKKYIITIDLQSVGPEVPKNGSKRLILS